MSSQRIEWTNIPFEICLIDTPRDGNCLFHAICNAFYKPYRTEMLDGSRISRNEIVSSFRRELAINLGEIYPGTQHTRYELLSKGNIKELGDSGMYEYTLQGLQSWLNSSNSMGDEIISFISEIIQKNIYFLDARTKDVYVRKNSYEIPSGQCIVVFYNGLHYDLCGIFTKQGTTGTLFDYNDPFITHIRNRINSRSSN